MARGFNIWSTGGLRYWRTSLGSPLLDSGSVPPLWFYLCSSVKARWSARGCPFFFFGGAWNNTAAPKWSVLLLVELQRLFPIVSLSGSSTWFLWSQYNSAHLFVLKNGHLSIPQAYSHHLRPNYCMYAIKNKKNQMHTTDWSGHDLKMTSSWDALLQRFPHWPTGLGFKEEPLFLLLRFSLLSWGLRSWDIVNICQLWSYESLWDFSMIKGNINLTWLTLTFPSCFSAVISKTVTVLCLFDIIILQCVIE